MNEFNIIPAYTLRGFFPLEILLSFFKDLSIKDIWHFAVTSKENYDLILNIQNNFDPSIVKKKILEHSFKHRKFDINEQRSIKGRTDSVIKLTHYLFIANKECLSSYNLDTQAFCYYSYPDRKDIIFSSDWSKTGPTSLFASPDEKYLGLAWPTEGCIMVFDLENEKYLSHVFTFKQMPSDQKYFQLLGFIKGGPILSYAEALSNQHFNFNTYNFETGEQQFKNSLNINENIALPKIFGNQQNQQYFVFPCSKPVAYHKILGHSNSELEPGTLSLERISTPQGTFKIRISRLWPLGNDGYLFGDFSNRLLDSNGPYYQEIIGLWEKNQPIGDPNIIQHILNLLPGFQRIILDNQCRGAEIFINPLEQQSSQLITPSLGNEILDVLVSDEGTIFVLSRVETTLWLNKILIENSASQISKIQLINMDPIHLSRSTYYRNSMKIHGKLLCIQPIAEIDNDKTILLIDVKTLKKISEVSLNDISKSVEYSHIFKHDKLVSNISKRTFFTDSIEQCFLIQSSDSTSALVKLTPHKFKPGFWLQQPPQNEEGNFKEESNNTQSVSMS